MNLLVMAGLPRSGKSTYADTIRKAYGHTIICPDDFRMALYGSLWNPGAEPVVWSMVEVATKALLRRGHDVVVDATNTTHSQRKLWLRIAAEFDITPEFFVMETDKEECIRRARELGQEHMVPVILRMAEQWEDIDEDSVRVFHA